MIARYFIGYNPALVVENTYRVFLISYLLFNMGTGFSHKPGEVKIFF